jgi:glutamate-1-semialdehyde 2,1-aminomutase
MRKLKLFAGINAECNDRFNKNIPATLLNEHYQNRGIYIKDAFDNIIVDIFDNTYQDMILGSGTFILGHNAIDIYLDRGTLHSTPNFCAVNYANLLSDIIPDMSSFVFCNTGSEATMRAIRIARAISGKSKIALFSGGWHGSHDGVLVDDDYDKDTESVVSKSDGIPQEILDLVIMLPYNDERAFEIIKQRKDEIAVVIIEPVQGSNPRCDIGQFLRKLREITKQNNVLLCFDEVITGFRLALGGGQEYFEIKADLATYGKIAGGGFPIGIVGINKEIDIKVREKNIFYGGTFSANPISMEAGYKTVSYLKTNQELYYDLNETGFYIVDNINKFCEIRNIPVSMIGIGSMFRFVFTDYPIKSRKDREKYEIKSNTIKDYFYKSLLLKGVLVGSNRINFLSTKHYEEDINLIKSAYLKTIIEFNDIGCFQS